MADVTCSPNAAVAYDFFVRMGLRDYQAAAIVGNLQGESGKQINPRLEVMDTNKKMSRGIAMWQPPRWAMLLNFAAGRDPWALETQLAYLWHELRTDPYYGLSALMASVTLESATTTFQDRFEHCSECHTPNRISNAKAVLFACPALRPPPASPRGSSVFAVVGTIVLAVAAAYGAQKVTHDWSRA